MKLVFIFSFMFVTLISAMSWADSISISGHFFDSKCDLKRYNPMRVIIKDAKVDVEESSYYIEFDMYIYICKKGMTNPISYRPQPKEFIEVLQLYPRDRYLNYITPYIPPYKSGQKFSHITFRMPREPGQKEASFGLDIYFFKGVVPAIIHIKEDGL